MKDAPPQQALSLKQITAFLRALDSPRLFQWKEQEQAARTLGSLPLDTAGRSAAVPRLRTVLQWTTWSGAEGTADWESGRLLLCRLTLVSVPLALLLTRCMVDPAAGLNLDVWISALLGNLVATGVIAFLPVSLFHAASNDHHLHRVRAAAAVALARLDDRQSIGRFIKVIQANWGLQSSYGSWRLVRACEESLSILLPALTDADYGRLPSVTTPGLCWLLEHAADSLKPEVLEALGKVGDGRAVSCVERIAAAGRPAALRARAERILPVLLERQRQENDPKILLRPSDATGVMQAGLLRPSQQTLAADPEQLLRPGIGMPNERT